MKKSRKKSVEVKRNSIISWHLAPWIFVGFLSSFVNFPAGDSWTHGWTVLQWANGNYILNDWSSADALPQQILGWLLNFGNQDDVQWTALALFTAIVTLAGILLASTFPRLLWPDETRLKNWEFLSVILILAAPYTMKIMFGFMTDGYYLCLLVLSIYFMLRAFDKPQEQSDGIWVRRWLGFAAFATLAALQRTHGLTILFIVPVWILFAKIIFRNKNEKNGFDGWRGWRGWLPIVLSVVGMIFALVVLKNSDFAPARSAEVTGEIINFWTGQTKGFGGLVNDRVWLAFGILAHFGLAMLPLLIVSRIQQTTDEKQAGKRVVNWWYVIFGVGFALMLFTRWAEGQSMGLEPMFPYLGNSITPEGFGPRKDTLALASVHALNPAISWLLTVLGLTAGLSLIWLLSRTVWLRNIDWRAPSAPFALIGLAHLGLIFLNPNFFDRYLLPLMPFAIVWLAPIYVRAGDKFRLGLWILVGLMFAFSLWGTVDYLNFSRAKWDIANKAYESGIPSDKIITGYETDGFFNFTNEGYLNRREFAREGMPWWVDGLGLDIEPWWVVIEKGADVRGTVWESYTPTDIENGRMQVWASRAVVESME